MEKGFEELVVYGWDEWEHFVALAGATMEDGKALIGDRVIATIAQQKFDLVVKVAKDFVNVFLEAID